MLPPLINLSFITKLSNICRKHVSLVTCHIISSMHNTLCERKVCSSPHRKGNLCPLLSGADEICCFEIGTLRVKRFTARLPRYPDDYANVGVLLVGAPIEILHACTGTQLGKNTAGQPENAHAWLVGLRSYWLRSRCPVPRPMPRTLFSLATAHRKI